MGRIPDLEGTHHLAEFGLVILMFTVGLEFSFPKLMAMKNVIFGFGGSDIPPFRDALLGIFFVSIPLVEMLAPDFIMKAECDLIDFIGYRRTWSVTRRFRKKMNRNLLI